ncbi:unnamed protein product, partial [Rotaria magnacalcarata]
MSKTQVALTELPSNNGVSETNRGSTPCTETFCFGNLYLSDQHSFILFGWE